MGFINNMGEFSPFLLKPVLRVIPGISYRGNLYDSEYTSNHITGESDKIGLTSFNDSLHGLVGQGLISLAVMKVSQLWETMNLRREGEYLGNSELSFFVNMKLWLFGSSNACKKQDRQNNTEEFRWYNRTIEQEIT